MNNYIIATGLINLYKEHKISLENERKDEPQFAMDLEFQWLTNNTYLEQRTEAIQHPLEQPYHKDFLRKREDVSKLATEMQLIFTGSVSSLYSNFVSCYELTLFKMYQYQVIINKMQKKRNKSKNNRTITEVISRKGVSPRALCRNGKIKDSICKNCEHRSRTKNTEANNLVEKIFLHKPVK